MESVVLCRNIHTGPRQGHGLRPVVSYCASPVPCAAPGPVSVQFYYSLTVLVDSEQETEPE